MSRPVVASQAAEAGPLWVITSYFNPAGYRRRLQNFRAFRRRLGAPLLAVELCFGGAPPALQRGDADLLLHCHDGDVLWQKERLLNLALARLPASCRCVAWVDADLLFAGADWPSRAVDALDAWPVLQLAAEVRHTRPDAGPGATSAWRQPALARVVQEGLAPAAAFDHVLGRGPGTPFTGMAWAARRDVLQAHGLYDRCVVGGGDTAFAAAAFGCPERAMALHGMNDAQRAAYRPWAEALHAQVRGRVGCLPQVARHLWHGEIAHRHAASRHALLTRHAFDPATDLRPGRDGAWRWAAGKPALHADVRAYFEARMEDGQPALAAPA